MSVNDSQVKHIAKLSSLKIDETKLPQYQNHLSSIIDSINEIKKLKLDGVEETSRNTEEVNVLRDDIVGKSFSQEEALQNAKKTYKGYFVVGMVLTNKDN